MTVLDPRKLHVKFTDNISPISPVKERRYTLTHSDQTGDLFLTIGTNFDQEALKDLQTRLMRDEVLGEWRADEHDQFFLHLLCHVSNRGLNFGTARWRYDIFKYHMPQVLQAMRYGDRKLYHTRQELDTASIYVHFNSHKAKYDKTENWGKPADYIVHSADKV